MLTGLRKALNEGLRLRQRSHHRYSNQSDSRKSLSHNSKASAARLAAVAVVLFALTVITWPVLTAALASDPAAGTISPSGPSVTWNGLALTYANPVSASEQTCQDGTNCDTFKLTISGTQADWAGKLVHIQIDWLSPNFD